MTQTPANNPAHASASLHGDALMTQLQQGWRPLPNKTLLALAMGGPRVRLMRSVVTMLSIVLAIAFLTYIGLSNNLNHNLALAMQRYASASPVSPELLEKAIATVGGIDIFAGLSVDQQRAVAVSLGMDQTDAAENDLLTLPDKITKAQFDLEEAEASAKTIEADPHAMKTDIDEARGKFTIAKEQLAALVARKTQLTEAIEFGHWVKNGMANTTMDMPNRLAAALYDRYHELLNNLRNPVKLSDADLDQLDTLLAMVRPKAGNAMTPIDAAMRQERGQAGLRGRAPQRCSRAAGLNTEKTLAGDPMDTWLIVMAMLTCAVGIANAMLMSVTERIREIGTMKCLGAQDNLVVKLFLLESAFLGVIGAVIGIVLGIIVALVAAVLQFHSYGLANFPLAQSGSVILMAVVGGILLAVVGAVYPAFSASRMRPVDALRVDE